MRKLVLAVPALAALTVAQPARADAACAGTVAASWVTAYGDFLVYSSWRGTHTQLCNIRTEWKGITPDVCASWVAKLDAAVSLGRTVTVYYLGSVDYAALPHYSDAPAPYYVMLQ